MQTLLNSINVLLGVGVLTVPYVSLNDSHWCKIVIVAGQQRLGEIAELTRSTHTTHTFPHSHRYAVSEGGWTSLGLLALLGIIMNYTGE